MSSAPNFKNYLVTDSDEPVKITSTKPSKYRSLWVGISVVALLIATVYLCILFFGSKCYIVNNFLYPSDKYNKLAYPVARNNLTIGFILLILISHLADQIACGNICLC